MARVQVEQHMATAKRKLSGGDLARWIALAFTALVLLIVLPRFLTGFAQTLMTRFLIFSIFAMGYNIIFGYGGMLSLGHGAFFGMGAYTVGLFTLHAQYNNIWVLLPLAILVATVGAAVLSFFFLRVSGGVYFLLITFGFSQLLYALAWNVKWFSSPGMQGISSVRLPAEGLLGMRWTNLLFYYVVFAVFLLALFVVNRIVESPFGQGLIGVRESENRMRALGYNIWSFKYTALVMSGAFAGLAGALYAFNSTFVHPTHLGFDTSWLPMLMVIVGGVGTRLGPIVGAAIVVWLEYFFSLLTPQRWPLFLGLFFIAVIMYFRGGIVAALGRLSKRLGTRWKR
jgi:branched-chain amino acid transport system permease protein